MFPPVGWQQVVPARYHRAPLRPPVNISAPPFPRGLTWFNTAPLRIDKQRGRPVVVEFWDICSPHSMRTLPYLREWHQRYEAAGLRVIGVHAPAFQASADPDAVEAAIKRLGIEYPVVVDAEGETCEFYGARGYPTRYLWDQELKLVDVHAGEGAYQATELLIQDLLGVERDTVEPMRPEEIEGAILEPPSETVQGPYSGPYAAGGVWVSVAGRGTVRANGEQFEVVGTGAIELISHPSHSEAVVEIEVGDGVEVLATVFTPGLSEEN